MFWNSTQEKALQEKSDESVEELSHDDNQQIIVTPPTQGRTLLPGPAAALVSGVTGITSFYVRAGTKVGGWGLYAGREATLKTLSVGRSVLETVLIAAGRDVSARSNGELGRAEAENILERSVCSFLPVFFSSDTKLTQMTSPRSQPFIPPSQPSLSSLPQASI